MLLHTGIGEVVLLPAGSQLGFDDQGFGRIINPDGTPAEPISTVLDRSLHCPLAGDAHRDIRRQFVFCRTLSTSTLVCQLETQLKSKVFSTEDSSGSQSVCMEVYEFAIACCNAGWSRFFTMAFVQHYVMGADVHNRWVCRNYDSLLRVLQSHA